MASEFIRVLHEAQAAPLLMSVAYTEAYTIRRVVSRGLSQILGPYATRYPSFEKAWTLCRCRALLRTTCAKTPFEFYLPQAGCRSPDGQQLRRITNPAGNLPKGL